MSMYLTAKKLFLYKHCSLLERSECSCFAFTEKWNSFFYLLYKLIVNVLPKRQVEKYFMILKHHLLMGLLRLTALQKQKKKYSLFEIKQNNLEYLKLSGGFLKKNVLMHITASPSVVLIYISNNSLEFHLGWMLEQIERNQTMHSWNQIYPKNTLTLARVSLILSSTVFINIYWVPI